MSHHCAVRSKYNSVLLGMLMGSPSRELRNMHRRVNSLVASARVSVRNFAFGKCFSILALH